MPEPLLYGVQEFVAGALEEQNLLSEAKLQMVYDWIDSDGNGRVSVPELRAALQVIAAARCALLLEMAWSKSSALYSGCCRALCTVWHSLHTILHMCFDQLYKVLLGTLPLC